MAGIEHNLSFDPETHQYWVDGEEVLSVTQILKSCCIIDDTWFTEVARQRGQAIHLATEYLDQNDLNWDSISPKIAGYVKSYKQFKSDVDFTIERIECPFFNPTYRFAGTPDRVGIIHGEKTILDLKIGQRADWHRLQTAGYALLMGNGYKRYGLYLTNKGTYNLDEHRNHQDYNVFLSGLTVANWNKRNGKGN